MLYHHNSYHPQVSHGYGFQNVPRHHGYDHQNDELKRLL